MAEKDETIDVPEMTVLPKGLKRGATVQSRDSITGETVEHVLGTVPDRPLVFESERTSDRVFAFLNDGVVMFFVDEHHDIESEYHANILDLMVEITGLDPRPEVGWIYADKKFSAPKPAVLSPAEEMAAAIRAGFVVEGSGTYDVVGPRWQMMMAEATYIATFGAFSGGLTELDWAAKSGEVVFKTTAEFIAVVRALVDRLTVWQRYVDGKSKSTPSGPIKLS